MNNQVLGKHAQWAWTDYKCAMPRGTLNKSRFRDS